MKVYLLLLLVLPLCTAQHNIRCYGNDFLMLRDLLLDCSSPAKQACYTRGNGEKGCTELENCSKRDWTCCYTDGCNA